MKLLITGAGGQVGRELTARAPGAIALTRAELDVGDADAVTRAVARVAGGTVINAAAYTAVDKAESEPEAALRINRDGPAHLAAACAATGTRLLHVSTDYVFDGAQAAPWREDDPIAPIGSYGKSKAAGEGAVRAALADHVILRTAWVFAAHGVNFVRTMLRLAAERELLRVVADQRGCPTFAGDIAETLLALAARPLSSTVGSEAWNSRDLKSRPH